MRVTASRAGRGLGASPREAPGLPALPRQHCQSLLSSDVPTGSGPRLMKEKAQLRTVDTVRSVPGSDANLREVGLAAVS